MQQVAYLTVVLFVALVATSAYFSIRFQIKADRQQQRRQAAARQLALELTPTYQAKVQADRAYVLQRERQTQELALKWEEHRLKQYLALHRIPEQSYSINEEIGMITAFPSLKRIEEKAKPFEQLLTSPYQPPTEEYLLSHIRENSLTVSPGIRASNGQIVQVDITQVPHGKLIGSSGFGKSTCMYIMLKQAAETNHPRKLQLALLDLEHKTSRLLEDYPHVATLRVGKRLVQMVATDADMVAEYLGYLKQELARRAQLSEAELMREPVLIIYVEEMLSLQYEVLDPKLLDLIFQSLTILSVRGKKYGMFLYACMQTDYSTEELKVSQKMFRFRGAASVDVSAARAAGFQNTELIKQNFQHGQPGQMVIEYPSFSDLVLIPALEIKHLLARKAGFQPTFRTNFGKSKPQADVHCRVSLKLYIANALDRPI
jgi:hypothetical protein